MKPGFHVRRSATWVGEPMTRVPLRSPERRLTRESADLVKEFLRLNRRRIRPDPPLSARELARWEDLRLQIEALLSGRDRRRVRGARRGPARGGRLPGGAGARRVVTPAFLRGFTAPAGSGRPWRCGSAARTAGSAARARRA